jgi:DNA primase
MISNEDKEKILQATQILDVISSFIPLKRRGANYIGLCPFHNEKTPSFNVNPARGIFKCFGCGKGGDAVTFLMEYQHYTYPEALKWLANKYGIDIQEKELTNEDKKLQDDKDKLYSINEFAQKYFYNTLLNDNEGKSIGLSYFNEREISQETIDTWGLGYCKSNYNDFTNYALKNGYEEELLINSGLTIKSERDNSLYDRFHGRVTFPIYNIGGRVLGFSARILTKEKTKAKYVNSPESLIYTKGKTLFGLNFAKNEIAKQDLCYLVEGNVDAIMMYQNNVKNTVASSGTALTNDQISLIKRYTKNVVILYDGDKAGIKAAFRATDLFLSQGLDIKILLFPDDDDPDSYARKHTQDEFQQFLKDNAKNFILYKTNLLLEEAKDDPIKKAELVKEIIHSISLIPDLIRRSTYLQQCSSILDMKEEILNEELSKQIIHNAFVDKQKQQVTSNTTATISTSTTPIFQQVVKPEIKTEFHVEQDLQIGDESQERAVISILLNYHDKTTKQDIINEEGNIENVELEAGRFIINDLINDEIVFDNPLYNKIFSLYAKELIDNKKILDISSLIHNEDKEIASLVSLLLIHPYSISNLWQEKYRIYTPMPEEEKTIDKDIKETLLHLKLHKIEKKIEKKKIEIKDCKDSENSLILLSQLNNLIKIRNVIAKELNIRIR